MSQNESGLSLVASAMLQHINTWPGKPEKCTTKLEKGPVSFMMQPLSGVREVRRYVNGSYIGQWPFALYLNINGKDTASRLDAMSTLSKAADWLETSQMPVIGGNITANKIEMTGLPALAAQYENGAEDYQAIFRLTFYQRRI